MKLDENLKKLPSPENARMTNRKTTMNEDLSIFINNGDFPASHVSFQGGKDQRLVVFFCELWRKKNWFQYVQYL